MEGFARGGMRGNDYRRQEDRSSNGGRQIVSRAGVKKRKEQDNWSLYLVPSVCIGRCGCKRGRGIGPVNRCGRRGQEDDVGLTRVAYRLSSRSLWIYVASSKPPHRGNAKARYRALNRLGDRLLLSEEEADGCQRGGSGQVVRSVNPGELLECEERGIRPNATVAHEQGPRKSQVETGYLGTIGMQISRAEEDTKTRDSKRRDGDQVLDGWVFTAGTR
ncbi:hypothetical protein B0T19DRAFT_277138 [Cercophora scortea]|uniref:Uncharacterized protein n=1 Tax=Cercophora scortea TaxID=314031 RepID=A0AAE0I962_9PEZI|nr:hypothetical protein B0T19DRAFT_277138 [Cercophora scortea]